MKVKVTLFGLLLFALSIPSFAQVTIGAVVFPQIVSLTSKNIRQDSVMSNKLSYAGGGGLLLGYNISDRLSLQSGVLYSAQNQKITSKYTLSGQSFTHESRKRFDYIKVPVLAKISNPIAGKLNFTLYGGPQFSYLLKYDGGMVVYIPDVYFDLPVTPANNNYYKKFVIELTAGAGVDFRLTKAIDLNSSLKVDYSITDTENKGATYNGRDLKEINGQGDAPARNIIGALMLGVTYRFGHPNELIAPSNKFRGRSYGKKRRF